MYLTAADRKSDARRNQKLESLRASARVMATQRSYDGSREYNPRVVPRMYRAENKLHVCNAAGSELMLEIDGAQSISQRQRERERQIYEGETLHAKHQIHNNL